MRAVLERLQRARKTQRRAPERVVGYETRLLDDREKIVNIMLALNNEGYHQTFTGFVLLSTAVGQQEIDGFLLALERSLHTLDYVAQRAPHSVLLPGASR